MDPEKIYKKILIQNGIVDEVEKVVVQDSGAKGDGMVSVTKRVTITFKGAIRNPLKIFVKLHTDNPSHEKFIEDLKAFEKEARFFTEYLPAARKLCASKGLPDLVSIYPKCYFADEQMIVLEDLCESGYQMISFENRHDLETAVHVLHTLAKHHALSIAMMKAAGSDRQFFQNYRNLDYDSHLSMLPVIDSFDKPLGPNITILEENIVDGKEEALALLKAYENIKFSDIAGSSFSCDRTGDPLFVLNHGDYKFNNMLFRIDGATKQILDHIAIDLQVTRYDSPAWDLSYYLFSTVDHNVRQNNLKMLLETYVNVLNKLTDELGCHVSLNYKDLVVQFKKKFAYAYWTSMALIGPGQEILKGIDIEKFDMIKMGEAYNDALLKWMVANPEKCLIVAKEIVSLAKEFPTILEL